jgi:hydrogenase maturation protein HypF
LSRMKIGARLHVTGIVQGVGFRPFVYSLADRFGLAGWVRNTSAGVDIEVDGPRDALEAFSGAMRAEAPPLARIDTLSTEYGSANGFQGFEIRDSEAIPEAFQPVSPDVALCDDCRREMMDPTDRRYRYPFINCTNCGPRFTIIRDIPYDRPLTTMAPFEMCPDCAREYGDPRNRRFHAQPVACPVCGPHVWLERTGDRSPRQALTQEAAIQEARRLLAAGRIVAIKGLGGFHLACDATNAAAVDELRRRKLRVDKPFALMFPDMASIELHCHVIDAQRRLLESPARPIVLLQRRGAGIVKSVAPGQDWLGVMLPYTPLHYLLLERAETFPLALVMTSGNLSEEPIAIDNDDARRRLASLADALLLHDREIHVRCDDSVVRAVSPDLPDSDPAAPAIASSIYPLRRSRGYVPFPVKLPWQAAPILAVGAELKNTFCITNRTYAFMSHHIGDMENYDTLRSFEEGISHFEQLFRVEPEVIVHDMHPDYLATRYARQRAQAENRGIMAAQHHHAHMAACMVEHGLEGESRVIGVALDGTGYGIDGAIWGGEILIGDYLDFERELHLEYVPLPGGDAAIRHPARVALALLWSLGREWDERLAPVQDLSDEERRVLRTQLERRVNSPLTSSMGRLFDAAASLAGVRQRVNYEAQAAIEFEALADPAEDGAYHFGIDGRTIKLDEAVASLTDDVLRGAGVGVVAARFHNGIAHMVADAATRIRDRYGLDQVFLSGGVWQNITLLRRTLSLLAIAGFRVYFHQEVPTNDGGLALGQAAIAVCRLRADYVPRSAGTDH